MILRAGPDADAVRQRTVVVFGAGALGGYIAVVLGESGVGEVHVVDDDLLKPGNVVRHVAGHTQVGNEKVRAVEAILKDHAPWTTVVCHDEAPQTPSELSGLIADVDLVVEATGNAAVTNAVSACATAASKPLISAALYRGGRVARVRRVAQPQDTPLDERTG